jgi:peptidoglycan/LPS O-acetylase OafA/YrhL
MQNQQKAEIGSLTGLRGIAALMVVCGHYFHWTAVTPTAAIPAWLAPWAGAAPGIGMSIFFTLSGFVIALSYSHWDWRSRPIFNFSRFFLYRFARLYPAFFVFAVIVVMRAPRLHDLGDADVLGYIAPHILLMQAWLPVKYAGEFAGSGPFIVSWSLSTECGLYLIFAAAAIVAAFLPNWRRRALVVTVLFSLVTLGLLLLAWLLRGEIKPAGWSDAQWSGWLFYISPFGIIVQFGIGVIAYRLSQLSLPEPQARLCSNLGAAGLVAVYLMCATGIVQEHVHQALLSGLSCGLLMVGASSSSFVNAQLTRPRLRYVGEISYSLYLFHFLPPGIAFHGEYPAMDAGAALYYAANFVVSLGLAVALATGIYHLVEVPGRRALRMAADRALGVAPARRPQAAQAADRYPLGTTSGGAP